MTKEQEKFVKDWSISDYQIIEDNLTVGGYLDLRGTSIKTLPDNLTVGGGLDLRGTSIKTLPDNLTVGGYLDLEGTSIKTLPDNLTVGGDLYLIGTSITTLPDNLTVGGYLDLEGTSIKTLPDNLTVGGYLDLEGTSITTLPDNLTVGGYLDLRGTSITTLPDNLTVGGDLYLSETSITTLPDNLTVGGDLNLRGTSITTLKVFKPNKDFMRQFRLEVEKQLCWKNGTYRKIDGIFCEVLSSKGKILKVKVGLKTAYIFFKNDVYAHGNTIKHAYYDWLFKTSDRDVEKYRNVKPNEVHTLEWWVIAYRTITGACSFGTNNFLENNKEKYKPEMTLEEVIKATEGQYGSSTFKEFFKS